ncbi:unnamed protein product [Coccothraustes coccothraustes]
MNLNESDYSWFSQLFSQVESITSSLKLLRGVWVLVIREAKKTSSQAAHGAIGCPFQASRKCLGSPGTGGEESLSLSRVTLPLAACLGKQYGLAPGLGGSEATRLSQKTVSGVLFILAALELSPDFGERSVGSGCLPGKRHGARMPCPERVVGMRLPHPFPPGSRPPPAQPGLESPAREKGRGRPRCPVPVGSLLPGAILPGLPHPTQTLIAGFFPTFTVNKTR